MNARSRLIRRAEACSLGGVWDHSAKRFGRLDLFDMIGFSGAGNSHLVTSAEISNDHCGRANTEKAEYETLFNHIELGVLPRSKRVG
ncbi:unnamed protein product [Bursaphelenchus xylophilus]|uniref:(pine wood nematode) hypothetical protein n=1 Tax=Bursaphelenchus xylophilus TaxID=6326 RepID=A0A7I8XK72_BURXY|nr:unnamed protein product [Bursaphelenchus xylophilus]CAG9120878.1 unnamed protein product [Bursaphelenchus xylophilus]